MTDALENVPHIIPVETMAPYVPCWCGSGQKWKFCHKDREKQKPLILGQLFNQMHQEAKDGLCLHPDAPANCSGKVIRAHTVQKSGGLKAIALDGHVLSIRDSFLAVKHIDDKLRPVKVGVNSASTFAGFCGKHDTELFRQVETGDVILDDQAMFLLAFRAISLEKLNKHFAVKWAETERRLDQGLPFERQAEIQMGVHYKLVGTILAVEDSAVWKAEYDNALRSDDLSDFWHYSVVFDQVLPFVGSGGAMPEFDFNGKVSQSLALKTEDLDHIAVNVSSFDGKSIISFGWLGKTGGAAEAFVRSFANVPTDQLAERALRFLFEHIENSFLEPGWWSGLTEANKNALMARMENGTLSGVRPSSCLMDDGERYLGNYKIERVISKLPEE